MLPDYNDIKKRIRQPPRWYDTNGVPRYDKFHPALCSNIYADEIILMEITCQACKMEFFVERYWSTLIFLLDKKQMPISVMIRTKKFGHLHYGDPPRHGCVGDTMNCDDIRIIEFWHKDKKREWKRIKKFETKIPLKYSY